MAVHIPSSGVAPSFISLPVPGVFLVKSGEVLQMVEKSVPQYQHNCEGCSMWDGSLCNWSAFDFWQDENAIVNRVGMSCKVPPPHVIPVSLKMVVIYLHSSDPSFPHNPYATAGGAVGGLGGATGGVVGGNQASPTSPPMPSPPSIQGQISNGARPILRPAPATPSSPPPLIPQGVSAGKPVLRPADEPATAPPQVQQQASQPAAKGYEPDSFVGSDRLMDAIRNICKWVKR